MENRDRWSGDAVELDAIEALHRLDETSVLQGDFKTLKSIMTPDAIVIPPGGAPVAAFEVDLADDESAIISYRMSFSEVTILGDFAVELGSVEGSSRKGDGSVVEQRYNVVRVLKREPEGPWRVHRAIWNEMGAPSS